MKNDPETLLNTEEAAAILGLSRYWLERDRTLDEPKVVFVRMGGAIRYRPSDLDAAIKRSVVGKRRAADAVTA